MTIRTRSSGDVQPPLHQRWFRVVALTAILSLGAGALRAQRVTLQIHPPVGDTLHMRLDQRFEMTSESPPSASGSHPRGTPVPTTPPRAPNTPSSPASPTPPPPFPFGNGPPARMVATMKICTHAVILKSTAAGTELQSITDSVSITPLAAASLPLFAQTKRALQGRAVRLHIGTDGAMTLPKGAGAHSSSPSPSNAPSQSVALAQIPAMLPPGPVQAGDSWARDLLVPLGAPHAKDGLVRVTFHLDSLGPAAAIAYISMHGTFSHDRGRDASGTADHTAGTLTGTMQVDRRLAWLTDSRTTVTVTSTMAPPGDAHPMVVHVKITQWLRAVPGT